jgi:hypothetical protein
MTVEIEQIPKVRRKRRRRRRPSIFVLPSHIRDLIWHHVTHTSAKITIEEPPNASSDTQAHHTFSVPWLGALLASRLCKSEIEKQVEPHKRVLTVEGLWLNTTLPKFTMNSNSLFYRHVRCVVFRTSQAVTSEKDNLRLKPVMEEYAARIRLGLPERLRNGKHEVEVEGELAVETGRTLLLVVHRVVLC